MRFGYPSAMPEWFIRVEFDPSDRESIEQMLSSCTGTRLVDRDGETYLRDDVLDERADREAVEVFAEAWVRRIATLVGTLCGRGGMRYSGVKRLQADGRLRGTVRLELISSHRTLSNVDLAPWSHLLETSRSDEALSRVLDILAAPNRGWLSRTHLLEIIEQDVLAKGGSISDLGWASRSQIKKYQATVNSFEILGTEARHARLQNAPPRPMSVHDAARFIDDLVLKWLEWRRSLLG